jgi:hypothetical protein
MKVRSDEISFEGRDISLVELSAMAGFLQVFIGTEAVKRGADIEDVKDNVLDIHLTAMQELERLIHEGKINVEGVE